MTLEPGEAIGAYLLVRLLGTGGMGAVYEVEHVELGVRYALKVFVRDHGDVDALRRRFRTEGKVLARLRHPNLVRVYDFGEDAGRGVLYFVMDLVVGPNGVARTLSDVELGEADERQLAKWYGELRSALEYIHSRGIVHRDFKPGNVLIDAQGSAILGDFGILRFVDGELREELGVETTVEVEKADARTIMGSVMFLAPEVRRGEKATAAADAYALGVTFFRLLTGIWYEPGPVADGFLAEFGEEWSTALQQLLSDNPALRLPIPPVEVAARSPNRLWRRIAAGCVAAIVVVVSIAFLFSAGTVHRAPLLAHPLRRQPSAGGYVSGGREAGAIPEPAVKYSFDQFFPQHKED